MFVMQMTKVKISLCWWGHAEDGCIQAVFLETAMVHWIELDLKARKPKAEILIYED